MKYNSRRYNYTTWRRGPLEPTHGIEFLVDKMHVSTPHWTVFYEVMGHRLKNVAAVDVFYLWAQTYNRHEANRRHYSWVMGGCR